MRPYITTAIALLASTVAVPAFAQVQDAPRPFTGVYVGGSFGYDVQPNDRGEGLIFDRNLDGTFGDTVTTAAGANAFSPGFCNGAATSLSNVRCNNDRDGISYYGRAGFDLQRNHLIGGVVGEFGRSKITDSASGFSTTPASYTFTRSLDWEATIRARAGYAFGTTLFYGTAGGGYAKIKHRFSTSNTANAFELRGGDRKFGLLAGGGVEQKLTDHISFGMEYMFHRYRDDESTVRVTRGSAPATNPFVLAPNTTGTDIRRNFNYFRWHSIRGTLAFRF